MLAKTQWRSIWQIPESTAQTRAAIDQTTYDLLVGAEGVWTVAGALVIYMELAIGDMVQVICRSIGRYTTPFCYSNMEMTQRVADHQEFVGSFEF